MNYQEELEKHLKALNDERDAQLGQLFRIEGAIANTQFLLGRLKEIEIGEIKGNPTEPESADVSVEAPG